MGLKDTVSKVKDLIDGISADLMKAEKGNKAAAQRVRVQTIELEKVAKLYRKESVQAEKKAEKKGAAKKAPAKAPSKTPAKKATAKVPKKKK